MAFFKSFRDQMKANALMSHLEFTRDRYRHDPGLGESHFAAALKALAEVKAAGAETAISREGWEYVGKLCAEIGLIFLQSGAGADKLKDLNYICEHAARWHDSAKE